jgi:hypothetical protein
MHSADLNMSTISGMTHIKTTFSFSPGTGKHFIGNQSAFLMILSCSSFTLHCSLFHDNVLYKPPEEKLQMNQIWPGNESHSSYPMFRKFPVQKGTSMTEVRWYTNLLENCSHKFFKKEETNNCVSHQCITDL